MPRIIPSTTWGGRTPPSTTWSQPRQLDCITWDEAMFSWDETSLTWNETCEGIVTAWDNDRYGLYVEDLNKNNILDLTGELVTGISGNETNILDTVWN